MATLLEQLGGMSSHPIHDLLSDKLLGLPQPLFFADLLEALVVLEEDPAEFFAAVIRRWHRAEA